MLWLFSGVSFWCLSLGMDELDKLRDEMAFLRGRVAAMEERNEDLSKRLRMVLAMYDDHLKRMGDILDQVEYMNKRFLDGKRHL
jgi:hypothetical protein